MGNGDEDRPSRQQRRSLRDEYDRFEFNGHFEPAASSGEDNSSASLYHREIRSQRN